MASPSYDLNLNLNLIDNASSKLKDVEKNLKGIGLTGTKQFNKVNDNLKKTNEQFGTLFRSIKRIAFYRALRTVLKWVTSGIKEGLQNLYQFSTLIGSSFANSMDSLATSVQYLKNSFGALLSPLINAIAPAIDWLIDKFVTLLNVINQVFALLTGASSWTKALKSPKKYMDTVASGAKKAEDAIKKLGLAQIDELTILDNSKAKDNASGGGAGGIDYSSMFQEQELSGKFAKIRDLIKDHIAEIQAILLGSLLVIGAILTFAGFPAIGVPLMIAGAAGLASFLSLNWDSLTPEIKGALSRIMGMLSGFLVVFGTLALFSGNIPLGIGLIIAGIAGTYATYKLNSEAIGSELEKNLNFLNDVLVGGLFAFGAILLFTGHIPLGLGLMLTGLYLFGKTVSVNWGGELKEKIEFVLQVLRELCTLYLGVLGIILIVTGNIPMGLGLLIAGIALWGTSGDPSWNEMINKVKEFIQNVLAIMGGALAVIGFILICMGDFIHGFGLLGAGVSIWGGSGSPSWDALTNKIQEICSNVKKSWENLKKSTSEIWTNIKSSITGKLDEIGRKFSGLNWRLPHIKLPHFRLNGEFSFMPPSVPSLSVDWYAKGGFPDKGSLFMANEAGPELVGSMNGRTAVANNDQIVAGIQRGVYEAMMSAMSSGSFNANVYLDGKQITDSVVRNVNNEARRTGMSPLEVY